MKTIEELWQEYFEECLARHNLPEGALKFMKVTFFAASTTILSEHMTLIQRGDTNASFNQVLAWMEESLSFAEDGSKKPLYKPAVLHA